MFLFLPKKAIISWVATITWKKKISGPAAIACGLFAILIDVTRCFWVSLMFLSRFTETIEGDEEHTLKSGFKFSKKKNDRVSQSESNQTFAQQTPATSHLAYQGGKQCYLGCVCLPDQKFCGELILPKERRRQAKVRCQKAKPKQHP